MPPLEIHVPISPTPNFFNRIHYLAASLRKSEGLAAESTLVVTVGEDQEPVDLASALPWSRKYPIVWRWLDRDLYRRFTYYVTALDRFNIEFKAPMALMLDADVLITKDFGDMVQTIQKENVFCASMAHFSPYQESISSQPSLAQQRSQDWWQAIFDRAGLGLAPFNCEYNSWSVLTPASSPRYCPPYFNFGALLASSETFYCLGQTIYQDMAIVDSMMQTPLRCQIALTLSLLRTRTRYSLMPLRYNFPNLVEIAAAHPDELRDLRIIHYMHRRFFDKEKTLDSTESVGQWTSTNNNLPSIAQVLRNTLAELHPQVLEDLCSS